MFKLNNLLRRFISLFSAKRLENVLYLLALMVAYIKRRH
jgi:hypothetical protein